MQVMEVGAQAGYDAALLFRFDAGAVHLNVLLARQRCLGRARTTEGLIA
jgi:hypothetical protein